jgi:two-component system, LytTR family, sensor kinase
VQINWNRRLIWDIKLGELSAFIGLYFILYLTYAFCLTVAQIDYTTNSFIVDLKHYLFSQFIDYSIKFILTIPIWYLYFKVLKNWSLYLKVGLHILTLLLFVVVWQKTFYFTMEALDKGHLGGSGQAWDVYIPALIYIIQFGFFHVYSYHLALENKIKNEAQLKEAALKSELNAIKAQLNPHFLYNTFNSISASIPPQMEDTREMIASLSDLFRYVLKASKEETVELREEINFIKKYLSLEQTRFGERLKIFLDVDPALLHKKIPPMILQPIAENAVKHGISPLIEGGEVRIVIKELDNKILFEVTDTGAGNIQNKNSWKNGIGLTNTKLRLEKIYGSQLDIKANVPRGICVSFII